MNTRIKYRDVTGVSGYAVIPDWYSDEDVERVKLLGGAFRNFQPKFVGTITYRARFTLGANGKVNRQVIVDNKE